MTPHPAPTAPHLHPVGTRVTIAQAPHMGPATVVAHDGHQSYGDGHPLYLLRFDRDDVLMSRGQRHGHYSQPMVRTAR